MRISNPLFVMETSTTTGTGSLTLAGAVAGFRTFASVFDTTGFNWLRYRIEAVDGNGLPTGQWEHGLGRLTTSTTLARSQIIANSAGTTTALDLASGTKYVCVYFDPFDLFQQFRFPTERNDFALANATAAAPFFGAAISSGTFATIAGSGNHPGVAQLRSSTTASSGYHLSTNPNSIRIAGGEYFCIAFRIPVLTNTTIRLGLRDNTTSADVVDGAYIEIPGTGAAVLKTANNSTRTTSATIHTLATNTWYSAHVFVRGDAGEVSGLIADESGAVLGTPRFNTANIPTTAGRETGFGVIATSSNTAATNLLDVDYMAFAFTKAQARG